MTAGQGGFRPLTAVTARWCHIDGFGVEHLTLEQHGDRITATAVVTSTQGEKSYAAWYQVFLDSQWRAKAVSVHRTDSRWFIARSPEPGHWCDGDGTAIEKLEGCRDMMLQASQFAHTPAIRRLDLAGGASREQDVFALSFETLVPARRRQVVTCLQPTNRYLIEDREVGDMQEIRVDSDGLARQTGEEFNRTL